VAQIQLGLLEYVALIGELLAGWGVRSDPAIYARSLDVNINRWWGLVPIGFGLMMLGPAARARGDVPSSSRPDA